MKDFLKRLITLNKGGEKTQETTQPKEVKQNVTPEWIESLKENEIFVFGCRNSGRHFDGAWVLGSMDQTIHSNYGNLENPDLKSFIDWVIERTQGAKSAMITTLPKEDEEKLLS